MPYGANEGGQVKSGRMVTGSFSDSASTIRLKRAQKWLDMLEKACDDYCLNPVYVQRVYYWRILLHMRKHR